MGSSLVQGPSFHLLPSALSSKDPLGLQGSQDGKLKELLFLSSLFLSLWRVLGEGDASWLIDAVTRKQTVLPVPCQGFPLDAQIPGTPLNWAPGSACVALRQLHCPQAQGRVSLHWLLEPVEATWSRMTSPWGSFSHGPSSVLSERLSPGTP